jgi:exopolysaccharide biosynthesis protein
MKRNFIVVFIFVIGLIISCSRLEGSDSQPVSFYSPQKGIYVIDVDTSICPDSLEPYVSDSLETVEKVAEKTGATVAINAGFFDPSNTKTTSYIIKDGQLVGDPTQNPHLMENPALKQYLSAILDRSEFRILDCTLNSGESLRTYGIEKHSILPGKCIIKHSIQGGPELIPEFKLLDEAFVVKKEGKVVKQSAGALGKYARSAIGIKDNHILLVAVSNENPMTLKQLANFMKTMNVDQAMAFDGGSSTSLYVNLPNHEKFILTSAKDNSARRVKSVLLVKPLNVKFQ